MMIDVGVAEIVGRMETCSFFWFFLSEYIMATGDTSLRPGLERLALETARGQGAIGTWGHRFALPGGNLSGYPPLHRQHRTRQRNACRQPAARRARPAFQPAHRRGDRTVRFHHPTRSLGRENPSHKVTARMEKTGNYFCRPDSAASACSST